MGMSRDDALALVSLIAESENLPLPRFRLSPRQGHARNTSISVPRWAFAKHEAFAMYYVCHEMAHLVERKNGISSFHHGDHFKSTEQRICLKFGVTIKGYKNNGPYPRVDQVAY